jgi:transcriptional regulator with XRE-family HTH domain
MKQLTPKEIHLAFALWLRDYKPVEADRYIEGFLDKKIEANNPVNGHWLEQARKGLLLSAGKLAKKMGISRAAYSKFEKNEEVGTISINSLARCADAMNCEFVYAIRPKEGQLYSKVIWEKILKASAKQIEIRSTPEHMKGFALAAIAREKMQEPKFRRSQNWAQS